MKTSLLAFFLFLGSEILSAQTLQIVPERVPVDEPAAIRATGLQPGEHVAIRSELIDGAEHHWSAQAEFIADSGGNVDASKQAPVKGSYQEIAAMGLVWSMKPSGEPLGYQPVRDLGSQIIQFKLLRNGHEMSSARLEQVMLPEGVRRIKVEGQLHGMLFVPATGERHPGVLVLGGSEGGVPLHRAAWLASHGFAALALAYFHYEDLPQELEAIPLEYFGSAIAWMAGRPEVLPDEIGVVGVSRGGELALQLGSMYPRVRAVVAWVPANVRVGSCCSRAPRAAWTWKGRPLAFARLQSLQDPAVAGIATIPVEQIHGPVMLISGQDDGVWPSSMMADAVVGRLRLSHFDYPVEHLKYSHSGHRAGRPEIVPSWHSSRVSSISGRIINFGGTAAGDARSSLDAAPKVLAFLRQSLPDHAAEK